MRRAFVSVVVAALVAIATYPQIVTLTHPLRCSTIGDGPTAEVFCVRFDHQLERYEAPPTGIPADFSRPDPASLDADRAYAVLLFLCLAAALSFGSRAGGELIANVRRTT